MFEKILRRIAATLKRKKIPYMIIGGQAVLLYGEPRLTRDIDITLGLGIDKLEQILKIIIGIKLIPIPDNILEFTRKTWVLPAEDKKTGIRVDFIFSFTPYEQQAIKRAKKVRMGKTNVCFASPEDVIIHKIFAGRARDMEDAKGILLKHPEVNTNYIKKWLKEFNKLSPEKNLLKLFNNL